MILDIQKHASDELLSSVSLQDYEQRHLNENPTEACGLAGKACRLDETSPFGQRNDAALINWAKTWIYNH